MNSQPSILVAGIGNVFLGDDGFGVEVIRRLNQRTVPAHVKVVDFGIRGMDLVYALLESYDLVILVDTVSRGGPPGTIYVMELDGNTPEEAFGSLDAHGMNPMRVLQSVQAMGGDSCRRTLLVGCEPESFGDEAEGYMGLSRQVEIAIDEAIAAIQELCKVDVGMAG